MRLDEITAQQPRPQHGARVATFTALSRIGAARAFRRPVGEH
jgi:hypothetical protein